VPVGTKIRTLAVGSSFGLSEALIVVAAPDWVTSSFGDVYAARAAGTAINAASDASPAAIVQIRPLICPPLLRCPSQELVIRARAVFRSP
jgi:hypothetical protein